MRDFSANGTFLYKYTFPLQKRKLIHSVLKQLEVGKVCVCVCVCVFLNAKSADSPLPAGEKRILNSFSSKEVV